MLYNHRHWFPKNQSDIKIEYLFARTSDNAIYDIDNDLETNLFLGQQGAARVYQSITKGLTALLGYTCQNLSFYKKSSDRRYQGIYMAIYSTSSNSWELWSYTQPYWPNPAYVLGQLGGGTRVLSDKQGVDDSIFFGITTVNYTNYSSIYKRSDNNTAFTYIYGAVFSIASISASEAFMVCQDYYGGQISRFRKYSDPTTNLAYPSAGLILDRLTASEDNTLLYGLAGGYWHSWGGATHLYIYDIANNLWNTISLPAFFYGFVAVPYNGHIFITGYDSLTNKAAIIKALTNGSNMVKIESSLDTKFYCGTVLNNVLYLGGAYGEICSYTEEVYYNLSALEVTYTGGVARAVIEVTNLTANNLTSGMFYKVDGGDFIEEVFDIDASYTQLNEHLFPELTSGIYMIYLYDSKKYLLGSGLVTVP